VSGEENYLENLKKELGFKLDWGFNVSNYRRRETILNAIVLAYTFACFFTFMAALAGLISLWLFILVAVTTPILTWAVWREYRIRKQKEAAKAVFINSITEYKGDLYAETPILDQDPQLIAAPSWYNEEEPEISKDRFVIISDVALEDLLRRFAEQHGFENVKSDFFNFVEEIIGGKRKDGGVEGKK